MLVVHHRLAGAATWSIGHVALEYYESGKRLNPGRIQQLYLDFYHRFRKENKAQALLDQENARSTRVSPDSVVVEDTKDTVVKEGKA
jgi:hypothetical protein